MAVRTEAAAKTELAERVGITLANLSVPKNGHARAIRFATLTALCRELDCTPGDLLWYSPAGVGAEAAGCSCKTPHYVIRPYPTGRYCSIRGIPAGSVTVWRPWFTRPPTRTTRP